MSSECMKENFNYEKFKQKVGELLDIDSSELRGSIGLKGNYGMDNTDALEKIFHSARINTMLYTSGGFIHESGRKRLIEIGKFYGIGSIPSRFEKLSELDTTKSFLSELCMYDLAYIAYFEEVQRKKLKC
jgi:hypothetical protein